MLLKTPASNFIRNLAVLLLFWNALFLPTLYTACLFDCDLELPSAQNVAHHAGHEETHQTGHDDGHQVAQKNSQSSSAHEHGTSHHGASGEVALDDCRTLLASFNIGLTPPISPYFEKLEGRVFTVQAEIDIRNHIAISNISFVDHIWQSNNSVPELTEVVLLI